MNSLPNSLRGGPDSEGHFGAYGGRYVAETLMPLLLDLEKAYEAAKKDPAFHKELNDKKYGYGRPGIVKQPWGDEMTVHDPFGNRIRFLAAR